jgi:voltage-gated sodium channel
MLKSIKSWVGSNWFNQVSLSLIVFSAIVVGLETNPEIMSVHGTTLKYLDKIVLFLFTIEIILRLTSYSPQIQFFFKDGWNIFDFVIVAICYLPIKTEYAIILRLVRILRALRLIKALPRLRMIVEALIKSIASMGYVGMLLFIVFYIYGVLGVFMFGSSDPEHFGSLPKAFLTIFQIMTLEGWVDLMKPLVTSHPIGTPFYFISFIFLGTMITLNLFIGIIISGMTEVEKKESSESLREPEKELLSTLRDIKINLERLESKSRT